MRSEELKSSPLLIFSKFFYDFCRNSDNRRADKSLAQHPRESLPQEDSKD